MKINSKWVADLRVFSTRSRTIARKGSSYGQFAALWRRSFFILRQLQTDYNVTMLLNPTQFVIWHEECEYRFMPALMTFKTGCDPLIRLLAEKGKPGAYQVGVCVGAVA